jgi:Zn-dependent peptidase ImmA (M78 family)
VLAIEASRLARNGRDWHTLIEFCGLVGTLIVDEDGIYDPRHPNDRLLLGMKGTMSELELSMFRQRSQEALKQKARRGALVLGVAAGYVKIGRDRIEKNPDKRVQDALQLVFTKFAELQSARQVHIWLREERIELPVKSRQGEAHGVVWRLPAYNIVHNILTNPIYAGAYAFGRTTSRVSVKGGRKHVRRGVQKPMAEWDVLIKDHHTAYITWDEFEHNLEVIANNATGMSSALARGAARKGELLLPGLLRCGHCGRKLHVHYSGKIGRYNCYGARTNHGAARCISISGLSIDTAISNEVLRVLKPLGIEAALKAIEAQSSTTTAAERQLELSLQQARYEAAHARRQYDAVDPANRLVAGELERRWNEALQGEGPITNMVALLESRGFVVARDLVGSARLDGVCSWSNIDQRPYVLLAKDKESFFRSQMDAAHEMGHALLHRAVDQEIFDRDFKLIEEQAFRLASAFLMPSTSFPIEIRNKTLSGFIALKERWRVSAKAMIKRCSDLDILDAEAATQLYKYYSARGWNKGEPLDDLFAADNPRLLSKAIRTLVEQNTRSKADLLANEFTLPASDIEQLTGLPEGWFDQQGELVHFRLRARTGSSSVTGEVFQFPGPKR